MESNSNKVILITGDRNWTDREKIHKVLTEFDPATTILIEGGARGADRLGREEGEKLGFHVLTMKADWKRYGKAAGPIRNREMYNKGHPDLVLAFHSNLALSSGTKDMINVAIEGGTPFRLTT